MILPNTLAMPAASPSLSTIPAEYLWRWSVDQYHEMIEKGMLTADDPVELLEGWLVTKMPKKPAHSFVTQYLRKCLDRMLVAGWFVNCQEPITLDTSEPEPDISAVRGQIRDYSTRHPCAEDIGLAVEVAESSLARDCGMKKRIYARARIPVYWIVNIPDRQVEVYTQPSGPAEQPDYAQRQDFGLADTVPVVIDGQEIGKLAVAEFLS